MIMKYIPRCHEKYPSRHSRENDVLVVIKRSQVAKNGRVADAKILHPVDFEVEVCRQLEQSANDVGRSGGEDDEEFVAADGGDGAHSLFGFVCTKTTLCRIAPGKNDVKGGIFGVKTKLPESFELSGS